MVLSVTPVVVEGSSDTGGVVVDGEAVPAVVVLLVIPAVEVLSDVVSSAVLVWPAGAVVAETGTVLVE